MSFDCPYCDRECPDQSRMDHHLKTRKVDRNDKVVACHACHKTIHALFSVKEIRKNGTLQTVEGVKNHPEFQRALSHIKSCPPGAYLKVRRCRQRGHRYAPNP